MWSLGVLIGGPVILLVLAICAVVAALGIRSTRRNQYSDGGIVAVIATIIAVLTIGIAAFAYYPYKGEYHRWDTKEGTVAEIDKRLIGSGDGMKEKFVVRFDESSQEYGCDDTRCALVEPGDYLVISCKRTWQYSGTDGWDCNFVERRDG